MTDKPSDLENAMRELDACNKAMALQSEVIRDLKELLRQTTDLLTEAMAQQNATLKSVMALPAVSAPVRRGRGRPKKNLDDSWMPDEFNRMKAEYIAEKKQEHPADLEVLTWYFERVFTSYGQRASKARSPVFQGKLKTFRNRLSDARNPSVKRPVK